MTQVLATKFVSHEKAQNRKRFLLGSSLRSYLFSTVANVAGIGVY